MKYELPTKIDASENEDTRRSEASRRNGLLGGVKTNEGKEISMLNSVKHGIFLKKFIDGENEIFDGYANELRNEFKTTSSSQEVLIRQAALAMVRLDRCATYEKETLADLTCHRETVKPDPEIVAMLPFLAEPDTLSQRMGDYFRRLEIVISRYEGAMLKRLLRLLAELRNSQT